MEVGPNQYAKEVITDYRVPPNRRVNLEDEIGNVGWVPKKSMLAGALTRKTTESSSCKTIQTVKLQTVQFVLMPHWAVLRPVEVQLDFFSR